MSEQVVIILKLLLATVLGGVIGYERERSHKEAGFRTHMLICLGSALFTVVSVVGFGGDIRIAAGVVTGIGFLGAGTILSTKEGTVHGLTTAASIWATAAIGLATAMGLYLVAVFTTFLVLAVLLLHARIIK